MSDMDAVVGLGANLGQREAALRAAVEALSALGSLVAVSSVYATEPIGPAQPDFLNAAVRLRTPLEPRSLLDALLAIEKAAGRQRRERWGPRTLDLDLLWIAGQAVHLDGLVVPHAELLVRAFALAPLLDVAPDATDPVTGQRYSEVLARLDQSGVRRAEVELRRPARAAVDTGPA